MISGLAFVSSVPFGRAQISTPVSGIITKDTTWTKTNSPYNLTGPVLVDDKITLTIEPSVIININNFYLEINGTLNAKGTPSNGIVFENGGEIYFTPSSVGWNEQTGSGSIVEYANPTLVRIDSSSPKISHCSTSFVVSGGSSSVISYNQILGKEIIIGGTPILTDNQINGSIVINGSSIL